MQILAHIFRRPETSTIDVFLFGTDHGREYQLVANQGRVEASEVEEGSTHKPFLVLQPAYAVELFEALTKAIDKYGMVPDRVRQLQAEIDGLRARLEVQTAWAQRFYGLIEGRAK